MILRWMSKSWLKAHALYTEISNTYALPRSPVILMHLPQHLRKLSSISWYWCCLQIDRACSISDSVISPLCDTFESSFSEDQLFYWDIKHKSNTASVLRNQCNCIGYREVEFLLIMENRTTRQYIKKSEYVVQSFIPYAK